MTKTRIKFSIKPNRSTIHLCLAVFWALLTIPALLWWSDSLAYVIIVSNAALTLSAVSAYEGSKAKEAVVESENLTS